MMTYTNGTLKRPVPALARAVVIGDKHVSPRRPGADITEAIGGYIRDTRPDYVVQIGDWADFPSLSKFSRPATRAYETAGTLEEDMAALQTDVTLLTATMCDDDYAPEAYVTYGNHEARVEAAVDASPRFGEEFILQRDAIFANNGWTVLPYRHQLRLGSTRFTHEVGPIGEGAALKVAQGACTDIVFGHTHRFEVASAKKNDSDTAYVQSVCVGCTLPQNEVEDWARNKPTGWSYGIVDLRLRHGRIADVQFLTIPSLLQAYGRIAA